MLLLQRLIGLLLITFVLGDCPISFKPLEVVVQYEASFSVDCFTYMRDDFVLSWEASNDTLENNIGEISKSGNVTNWEMQLTCHILFNETQCSQNLSFIVYKTPDSVSISTVNYTGPMMEGHQYELQCDVLNVAPVQYLTVNWYKGQTLVDQTIFNDTIKTPVNKTSKLLIRPDGADDGAQYWCEAKLELGEEGPQPPPTAPSEHLNITYYGECPVQLNPQRVVVEFGGPVSADCSTYVPHKGMGWEASEGGVPMTRDSLITWRVPELREWDIKPYCFINHKTQCTVNLPVTIYKTPDSVSISTVNHNGPMMEENQYELQCDVLNVAPVQYLTVNWYKGQTLVDQTIFNDTIKTPVNKTSKLLIRPDRADDGAQYWCEAKLELGEEGPQPPPTAPSEHLNITYYGECPVQLNPQRVVVEFGGPVSADCSTYVPHKGMGWEASEGGVPMTRDSLITWRVPELREWDIKPYCFINHKTQCTVNLPVTIYKTPDSVSISTVNHTGPMMEGNQYELQCDVLNVAPVQYLTVNWYKRQTLVNQTIFNDTIKTPVNKTSKLLIRPDRADDGAQYWCEAKLELGEEGPRPPPTAPSEHLNITVYYAPVFHASQDKFVVAEDSNINLECNSSGNPDPEMWWSFNNKTISTGRRQITLNIKKATSTSAGVYTCSAKNKCGRQEKTFKVEIRGNSPNYIPIVIAVVALLVIIIAFLIYLWIKKQSTGSYQIQPVNQYEMRPLNNGGEC